MNVEFNKNLELIFGLLYCVDLEYNIFPKNTFLKSTLEPYCNEFYNLYQKYASKELKEYIRNGGLGSYDTTAIIALSIDESYNIIESKDIENIERILPSFNKEKLTALLKDYTSKSNYEEFYQSHLPVFKTLIDKYKEALNKYTTFNEKILFDFFGHKIKDFKILLYNFTNGSCGINLGNFIYNINSITLNEKQEFSPRIINTCFHEFSHPYVNPLGSKYFSEIDLSNLLQNAIENNLESSYINPIYLINEYVVRAIQVYLASKYMEEDYIQRQIIYHKNRGYTFIEEIINLFEEKDNYSTFEEFYKNKIVLFFLNLNESLKETPKL